MNNKKRLKRILNLDVKKFVASDGVKLKNIEDIGIQTLRCVKSIKTDFEGNILEVEFHNKDLAVEKLVLMESRKS